MNAPPRDFFWPAAGSGLALAAISWSWLSRRFVYGEGHAERPILLFLACAAVAWVIFFAAARRVQTGGEAPIGLILGFALAARVALLPSGLILENDPYRYVLDGQMTMRGENPYLYAPADRLRHASGETRLALESEPARLTLSRIGYPEIPTVYPPASQLAFAAGTWLSGWDWRGQRWVFLAMDVAVMALLAALLRRFGAPAGLLLLYAWNPLILKEVANSAHLDIQVALWLAAAVWSLSGENGRRENGRAGLAGAFFGLAVMSKLYPAILFPAFFLHLGRRWGLAAATLFSVAAGSVCAGLALPFLGDGIAPMLRGLEVYAGEWRMNEGLFSLLEAALPAPRIAVALAAVAFATLLPWSRRDTTPSGLILQLQWILLVWFLLLPAPFPWYALPLAALAPLASRSAPARATIVLSGAVLLYYLSFHVEYQGLDAAWWTAMRALEHGIIWVSLGWHVLAKRRIPA